MGYIVRLYQPGDEKEIVQLLQLVFDGWPHLDLSCTPLDHWRWKYESNPLKMNFITVGISLNKTIGCDHGVPLKIKIGDTVHLCDYSGDTVVHPEYRRMGVSKKMIEQTNEQRKRAGVKFLYWVTRNPIFIKSYSKIRPRFPHIITNLVRIVDVNQQLRVMPVENAWLMKLGFHAAKFRNDIRNAVSSFKPSNSKLHIFEVHRFDDRINDFWDEISGYYSFIVERRQDYLNWRYCDSRAGDFIVKQAEENGQILGYSVQCINRYLKNYPIGYLVDLLALPDRFDVVDALVKDSINFFDTYNLNIVNCLAIKNHPYERIFNRHGFLDSMIRPHVFYNPLGMDDKLEAIPVSKAHFSYGDIDSLPTSLTP